MNNKNIYVGLICIFFFISNTYAIQDGQCLTPPMGWNSWNYYSCDGLNEEVILATAQAMIKKHPPNWEGVELSLKDVGYVYVNIDDCWLMNSRNKEGRLQVDTLKFPHCSDGTMKWLADTIHKMGLKIGIYSCAGKYTCCARPGSYGYEEIDAATFAEWEIDYIKHDWCTVPAGNSAPVLYSKMYHALKKAYTERGRTFVFSICEWGKNQPWLWADSCGHLWRTTGDIQPNWRRIIEIIDEQINNEVYHYGKPGGWNDPDMLEVGNGELTLIESQAHFDLWCIQAAPLILGNNLTEMSEEIFTIISNREVIAVNQDSLGWQGRRIRQINNSVDIWVKKMASPDTILKRKYAVVLFNRGTTPASGEVTWADIGETQPNAKYIVRDLWKHEVIDSAKTEKVEIEEIPPHGTVHLLLTRRDEKPAIKDKKISINEIEKNISIRYCAGKVEIYLPDKDMEIRIFDMMGRKLLSFKEIGKGWHRINIEKYLPAGILYVYIKSKKEKSFKRIVTLTQID